ncbi:MAG: peptide synthase, partial [Deltaproteobacteria bacterium]|nr:peptide synthase [Deltaproteobacteria bacterium]
SALVGIGPKGKQRPVICIELKKEHVDGDLDALKARLLELARENPMTEPIKDMLFHKFFPVDIRHNAKIFREKLALWAAGKLKKM